MKESLLNKLEALCARHEEIAGLLADIEVINDQDRFRNLSMEYAQLEDVVKNFNAFQQAQNELAAAREMLSEEDAEMRELAEEEITDNENKIELL
jgi:peptide chain release factor 1